MLRAMDSAVSGLRAHQNKLDVIGNNLANVSTFGYKAQSIAFKEALYQNMTSSNSGEIDSDTQEVVTGGGNAAQFGYGVMTGSISADMGASTPTFVGGFNACINGPGFFLTRRENSGENSIGSGTDAIKNGGFQLSRVGQFSVDSNGYIVDANQNFVYGYRPDDVEKPEVYGGSQDPDNKQLFALKAPAFENGTFDLSGKSMKLSGVELSGDGLIKGVVDVDNNGTVETKTIVLGKIAVASFQNQDGLTKIGNSYFEAKTGDNTGEAAAREPGGATSSLLSGYLEGSNVDMAKEFADMITAQRGLQANAKMITVSDEVLNELVNLKR